MIKIKIINIEWIIKIFFLYDSLPSGTHLLRHWYFIKTIYVIHLYQKSPSYKPNPFLQSKARENHWRMSIFVRQLKWYIFCDVLHPPSHSVCWQANKFTGQISSAITITWSFLYWWMMNVFPRFKFSSVTWKLSRVPPPCSVLTFANKGWLRFQFKASCIFWVIL